MALPSFRVDPLLKEFGSLVLKMVKGMLLLTWKKRKSNNGLPQEIA
jgi:hypothetical protein